MHSFWIGFKILLKIYLQNVLKIPQLSLGPVSSSRPKLPSLPFLFPSPGRRPNSSLPPLPHGPTHRHRLSCLLATAICLGRLSLIVRHCFPLPSPPLPLTSGPLLSLPIFLLPHLFLFLWLEHPPPPFSSCGRMPAWPPARTSCVALAHVVPCQWLHRLGCHAPHLAAWARWYWKNTKQN